MEFEPVAAFEHAFDFSRKPGIGVKPRHFVLVLVGHELEVISCDGLGEREFSFGTRLVRFHRAHPLDQLAVSLGIAAVLVAGEELYPARDQLVEVARERLRDRNDLGRSREPLHPRKIDSGAPPP